jgi:glutaredoxin
MPDNRLAPMPTDDDGPWHTLRVIRERKHAYIYKARLRAVSLHQGREDRNGLAYSEIDVTEDQAAADRLRERGFQTTPVVNAGDEWWQGFRVERLRSLPEGEPNEEA